MHIVLKKGSKMYLNGAVIRVDRKVNIELLNDAKFLLESNIMEADEANTPLKHLYYVLQSSMLRPEPSPSLNNLLKVMVDALKHTSATLKYMSLEEVSNLCNEQRYFEALKKLRVIMNDQAEQVSVQAVEQVARTGT